MKNVETDRMSDIIDPTRSTRDLMSRLERDSRESGLPDDWLDDVELVGAPDIVEKLDEQIRSSGKAFRVSVASLCFAFISACASVVSLVLQLI